MGTLLDRSDDDLLPTINQTGSPVVDNKKADEQAIPRTKPVRGIDWNEIFNRRPDLEPPGFKETVKLMDYRAKLGGQD